MSFIDTLKSLLGFTGSKETVENIVVPAAPMMETPVTVPEPMMQAPVVEEPVIVPTPAPEPTTLTPIEESPEEKIVVSEPAVHTMESDMNVETPVVETPVETVVETVTTTENQ